MTPQLAIALFQTFAPLIEKVGLDLYAALLDIFSRDTVTGDDIRSLKTKYGLRTDADYDIKPDAPALPPLTPAPGTVTTITTEAAKL